MNIHSPSSFFFLFARMCFFLSTWNWKISFLHADLIILTPKIIRNKKKKRIKFCLLYIVISKKRENYLKGKGEHPFVLFLFFLIFFSIVWHWPLFDLYKNVFKRFVYSATIYNWEARKGFSFFSMIFFTEKTYLYMSTHIIKFILRI